MDEHSRKEVVSHLDELRRQVEARAGHDATGPLLTHLDELRTLVAEEESDKGAAHTSARGLEQRLLAWEAEHPTLVALATRVVRALENAGL